MYIVGYVVDLISEGVGRFLEVVYKGRPQAGMGWFSCKTEGGVKVLADVLRRSRVSINYLYFSICTIDLLVRILYVRVGINTYNQGDFCDGMRRYGVPAPFFPSKEKNYL